LIPFSKHTFIPCWLKAESNAAFSGNQSLILHDLLGADGHASYPLISYEIILLIIIRYWNIWSLIKCFFKTSFLAIERSFHGASNYSKWTILRTFSTFSKLLIHVTTMIAIRYIFFEQRMLRLGLAIILKLQIPNLIAIFGYWRIVWFFLGIVYDQRYFAIEI